MFTKQLVHAAQGVMSVLAETGAPLVADPAPTTPQIGAAFLDRDRYLLPFEAISVLLLVVLVGAVTLVRRGPEGER